MNFSHWMDEAERREAHILLALIRMDDDATPEVLAECDKLEVDLNDMARQFAAGRMH